MKSGTQSQLEGSEKKMRYVTKVMSLNHSSNSLPQIPLTVVCFLGALNLKNSKLKLK